MIHQSGFSWTTREVSDVTTIIHQKKYQLYLFIFAQHFTVIYLHLYPPQPTHIIIHISPCFLLDQALHPKNPHLLNLPSPPSHLPRCWHGKCRTAGAQDDAQHIQHTQQLGGEPLRAGAGGSGGRCPRCPKRWWQKRGGKTHVRLRPCQDQVIQVIQELILIWLFGTHIFFWFFSF